MASTWRKSKRREFEAERGQAAAFRTAARLQRRCANCGIGKGWWDAHHVIPAQELRRRQLPIYDERNALRLCRICHEHHTNAIERIPIAVLLDCNLEYAFEAMGAYGYDYLLRFYAGEPDERMTEYAAAT